MDLHIYIDESAFDDTELNDIAEPVIDSISNWLGEEKKNIQLLNDKGDDDWKIGMGLKIKSKYKLKDPLNFLYGLAKTHKCEFVIAIVNTETNTSEDVCYFGYEEGQPDLFEIANYLEL